MTPDASIVQQLRELDVTEGDVVVVHTSFSALKPVDGGPGGFIEALIEAIGSRGTLVMPSMTSDDDHPFDVQVTACPDMGVVADTFWRRADALRSDNPHAFAARGPHAERITAAHPIDPPHGVNSPVGRAFELDAKVLLAGVGHDANTTVHLAENLAAVRYRRPQSVTIMDAGGPVRLEYDEIDHCCQKFSLVGDWLDAEGLQRKGPLAHGEARLARSRDIVRVVKARLLADETVFLHPRGVDEECDDAWRSLSGLKL